MTAVQPDLFGEFDAAEDEKTAAAARRDAYTARFERRDFPAPHDTADGREAGHIVHGWVCPACGGVEWNDFLLGLNHGYHTYLPGQWPGHWAGAEFGETCTRLIHREFRASRGLPNDESDGS